MFYQMFNTQIKNEFLSNAINFSYESSQSVFEKCFNFESEFNKDVFDFDVQELRLLEFSQHELLILEDYVYWSIEQGIKANNINTVSFLIEE
jgi:hypothetical protein